MGRKKSRFYDLGAKQGAPVDTNADILPGGLCVSGGIRPAATDPLLNNGNRTGKRAREFEKYVVKKLKKQERPALFQRLQELAFSSAQLQSSKQLGIKDARARTGPKVEAAAPVGAAGPTSYQQLHGSEPLKVFTRSVPVAGPAASDESSQSSSDDENDAAAPATPDPAPNDDEAPSTKATKAAFFVLVERSADIEEQRARLPIYAEEQAIMDCIRAHPVSIICGETGSGKTTQVPQFLFEAGYGHPESEHPGLVGVTQPRRVAAVSMAARVQQELGGVRADGGLPFVAHQVRFDSEVRPGTRIKFMTDGVLLRELASDFLLARYSVVILDEAHERNLNTDILLGMLSRAVRLRNQLAREGRAGVRPLRLVIMSATLDVEELLAPRLFSPPPPVLRVGSRQHPVTVHFSRCTRDDHVDAAFRTVCKIHANLPTGGVLVFLTGKQEIAELSRRLARRYPTGMELQPEDAGGEEAEDGNGDAFDGDRLLPAEEDSISDGDGDWSGSEFELDTEGAGPLAVVPLHSLLSPAQQQRVFVPPPEGSRLCVLATNVAETSITIPGIRYVVDTGKVKQRVHCPATGTQRYEVVWASQASAAQRAGRAGRTGPGHCYRLFSAAVFEQRCPPHAPPEILRAPVEALVLRLRAMGIDAVRAFPLPAQPDASAVDAAEQLLRRLGALDPSSGRITRLGGLMADVPLAPRWARVLLLTAQDALDGRAPRPALALAVALTACLAVGDPFVLDQEPGEASDRLQQQHHGMRSFAGSPVTSDVLAILGAYLAFCHTAPGEQQAFCARHGLLMRRLEETGMQHRQLSSLLSQLHPGLMGTDVLPPAIDRSSRDHLRRALADSLTDHMAERVRLPAPRPALPTYRLLGAPVPTADEEAARKPGQLPSNVVLLQAASCLRATPPRYLAFTESTAKERGTTVRYATAIEQAWIPEELLL